MHFVLILIIFRTAQYDGQRYPIFCSHEITGDGLDIGIYNEKMITLILP